MNILILQFLLEIIFVTILFLHVAKKNYEAVIAYGMQSLVIVLILFNSFLKTGSIFLFIAILLLLVVKVILAPIFFVKLIKKHEVIFSASTYFNMPITLIFIVVLTFIAHSQKFAPLTGIIPANQVLLSFALSSMFLSLFLIINRRGSLSQVIGILSFENSIVAFAIFAGLEQSAMLQMGIIFDIFVWVIIATVFISMIYQHFGSLDVTSMRHLKD